MKLEVEQEHQRGYQLGNVDQKQYTDNDTGDTSERTAGPGA